jgi:hypothetical protein
MRVQELLVQELLSGTDDSSGSIAEEVGSVITHISAILLIPTAPRVIPLKESDDPNKQFGTVPFSWNIFVASQPALLIWKYEEPGSTIDRPQLPAMQTTDVQPSTLSPPSMELGVEKGEALQWPEGMKGSVIALLSTNDNPHFTSSFLAITSQGEVVFICSATATKTEHPTLSHDLHLVSHSRLVALKDEPLWSAAWVPVVTNGAAPQTTPRRDDLIVAVSNNCLTLFDAFTFTSLRCWQPTSPGGVLAEPLTSVPAEDKNAKSVDHVFRSVTVVETATRENRSLLATLSIPKEASESASAVVQLWSLNGVLLAETMDGLSTIGTVATLSSMKGGRILFVGDGIECRLLAFEITHFPSSSPQTQPVHMSAALTRCPSLDVEIPRPCMSFTAVSNGEGGPAWMKAQDENRSTAEPQSSTAPGHLSLLIGCLPESTADDAFLVPLGVFTKSNPSQV